MVNNFMRSGSRTIEYAYQQKLGGYVPRGDRPRLILKDPYLREPSIYKTGSQDILNNMDILYFNLTSSSKLWKKLSPQMLTKIRFAYLEGIRSGYNQRCVRKF